MLLVRSVASAAASWNFCARLIRPCEHWSGVTTSERHASNASARKSSSRTSLSPTYRLIKETWAFRENRIAVRFAYEWHDDRGNWFRSYGNENWEFDENGLMRLRIASINDLPVTESERRYHWPLGRRPDDHPSLSDLGF